MKTYMLLGGAGLAATLAVAAFAQAGPPPGRPAMPTTRAEVQAMVAAHFKEADTNKDGVVTRAEFDAARDMMRQKRKAEFEKERLARRLEAFAALDTDKNGALSKAEFTALRARGDHGPDRGSDSAGKPDMPPPPPGEEGPGGRHGGPDGPGHGRGGMKMQGPMGGGGMGERWFERADANDDNKVSLAEASAGPLAMFDRVDTNKDGKISTEEQQAARDGMRGRFKGGRDRD